MATEPDRPTWTFLTNHAHVLLCIHRDGDIRLRDLADAVGITERAAQKIVADLADAGYLRRQRVGRRNRYEIIADRPLRHPVESGHDVGALLALLERVDQQQRSHRRQVSARDVTGRDRQP
ncbi:MAG TPA: winged helix-turn-helix domain-containing protein [Acidothermaceae bacterium]